MKNIAARRKTTSSQSAPRARARTAGISPAEMQKHASEAALFLKALANEQRLRILCSLLDRPLAVNELNAQLDLSQSALSQHLAVLREGGLVTAEREGQTIRYFVPGGNVRRMLAALQDIFCPPPGR